MENDKEPLRDRVADLGRGSETRSQTRLRDTVVDLCRGSWTGSQT